MMGAPNLHFPPELRETADAIPAARRALAIWRRMEPAAPDIAPGAFSVSGYGPQHQLHGHRVRLPPVGSPHSLLFRTEDNLSFITKIIRRQAGFSPECGFVPAAPASRSLHYASVGTGKLWTPATSRLEFALANYGSHWACHFQTAGLDENLLGMFGLEVERRRVLLLAIERGRQPLFRGLDQDELVIRGPINVRRIFILNDSYELFSALADIEVSARGLSLGTRTRMEEMFLALSCSDEAAETPIRAK